VLQATAPREEPTELEKVVPPALCYTSDWYCVRICCTRCAIANCARGGADEAGESGSSDRYCVRMCCTIARSKNELQGATTNYARGGAGRGGKVAPGLCATAVLQ